MTLWQGRVLMAFIFWCDTMQANPLLPPNPEIFQLPKGWLMNRPPRYEPLKRNVWVSKPRPKRQPKDEISVCMCPPNKVPHCSESCLNRLSLIHCDTKSCPCGELCTNKPFHMLKMPKMEAFKTENRCVEWCSYWVLHRSSVQHHCAISSGCILKFA